MNVFRSLIRVVSVSLAGVALAAPAHALLIDFTSRDWSDVSGTTHTESVAGVGDVTLVSTGGSLTFNDSDSDGCFAGSGNETGLACVGDGIGIGDDEVTRDTETLRVSFASPVNVLNILLLDLYAREPEYAWITLNGSTSYNVNGGADLGGLIVTGISGGGITEILFSAYGSQSDYALAGIEVAAVPLPGALLFFVSGLAGLGFFRRRRAA